MKIALIVRGLVLASVFSGTVGCASIVSESKYPVSVTSTPSGANFEIKNEDGQAVAHGVTPGYVILDAGAGYFDGETYRVTYDLEGYDQKINIVDTELNNWYLFGNLGFGGLIGWFILDPATGAMYKLPPQTHTTLSLAKAQMPSQVQSGQSQSNAMTGITKDQKIRDLPAQHLSYEEYMQRVREINSQP